MYGMLKLLQAGWKRRNKNKWKVTVENEDIYRVSLMQFLRDSFLLPLIPWIFNLLL